MCRNEMCIQNFKIKVVLNSLQSDEKSRWTITLKFEIQFLETAIPPLIPLLPCLDWESILRPFT